ncbi:unnamed protein product, partial [Mesorhabditis belari]|uniref:RNA polymerase II-associated factor 1 homolog n=1 Tax=Mesorhabditis belari TaxID=2138241 RepID=A0AAF3EBQ3_9BILA
MRPSQQSSRPSIQPGGAQTGSRPPQNRNADFICTLKYSNALPDLPFSGKFLPCPFVSLDRFVEYKATQLEKEHRFEVQSEADVGVKIDLIDPLTYSIPVRPLELNQTDAILVSDETSGALNNSRSLQHSKVVPWMRKTEYISSEFNRFGVTANRQETRVGYKMQKNKKDELTYQDRQSKVDAIAKTFVDVKKKVTKHYNKKDVYAVEELPLLPDVELWKYSFALVQFDADPSPSGVNETMKKTVMGQGQIRGMQDASGEQFVTYFCPNDETLQKRYDDKEKKRLYDPEMIYEYPQCREYTWNVRNKGTKGFIQDSYFFSFRDEGIYYNELGTSVKLTRRKHTMHKRAVLALTHCEPSEDEVLQLDQRLATLLQRGVEEDEADGEESDGNESDEEKSDEEDDDEEKNEESEKESEKEETPPRRGGASAEIVSKNESSTDDDDSD